MDVQQEKPKRWLDFTINVQGLIWNVAVAVAAGVAIYFGVVKDVVVLQAQAQTYNARFERIDSDMKQQRDETKEQLKTIGQNVEKIRDYLLDNAAGQRPEIKRWTR